MDTRPDSRPRADAAPYSVSLADPGELAAAIPQLLGFRPSESVVLISLGGRSGGRVGLTVRADIPPEDHLAALAAALVRSVLTDRPAGVLLAVVSEAADDPEGVAEGSARAGLPHRRLVREFTMALTAARVPLREALLVRTGRWWSYDCPHACCAPQAGTPVPTGVSELETASVAAGIVVEGSRSDLEARIAPPADRAGDAVREACVRAAGERWALAGERGWEFVAQQARTAVGQALARCRPLPAAGGGRLDDDELAAVVCGLRDVTVRDWALQLALDGDDATAEALWTECTRRAPGMLAAAPATLLAVSAWLRGDGAMANVALERACDSDPEYTLALLLRRALAACLTPAELREMIAAAGARLGDASRP